MTKNFNLIFSAFTFALFASLTVSAQQPKYTPKHFVSVYDEKEFTPSVPNENGPMRTYLLISPEIWDVDDNNTTHIKTGQKALVCIEGQYKNGQRDGIFTAFLIDSFDHNKRYKLWEQTYADNKLNGEWRTYSIKGNLVRLQTYKKDSLNGTARDYWIDGKSIMEERVYFNGKSKYIHKKYSQNGKVKQETTVVNGVPNGPAKMYYPDGTLMDEVVLINGVPNGLRRYYYPSGKIWIEQEMKDGNPWTVIANYTESGKKRNAGTLKKGNGTVILYDEDGTARETVTYKNGIEIKQ